MSIPDGEYDIDLLVLESSHDPLVALRYGFIPDSMDQSKPLTLFMTDQACVLEAPLIEKPGAKLLPIIFEGLPQRQRPVPNGTLDSYFLTVSDGKATLRRLQNTVRVNKSRNAEKWRGNIAGWRANATEIQKNGGLALPVVAKSALLLALLLPSEMAEEVVHNSSHRPSLLKTTGHASQNMPHRKLQGQSSQHGDAQDVKIKGMADTEPVAGERAAGERAARDAAAKERAARDAAAKERDAGARAVNKASPAPTAVLQKDRAKLRESVFRNPDRRKKTGGQRSTPELPKPASKRPPTSPETKLDIISASDFEDLEEDELVPEQKARPRGRNNEMDDDFKDLEDQLEEVLEEPNMSDSDDSEFAPIVIQVNEDNPKRGRGISQRDTSQKPMSLRELYGGTRNDELSSSEEE